MYKITATAIKAGNLPVSWTRFSEKKLTKSECEKMLSGKTEAGKSVEEQVTLRHFQCRRATKYG